MNVSKILLDNYQVRKNKKQKDSFIEFTKKYAEDHGYACRTEKGVFGSRNIIVGDTSGANVIYTAHYDTCTRLPFPNFITPKKISLYIAYQLVLTLGLLAIFFVLGFAMSMLLAFFDVSSEIVALLSFLVSYACLIGVLALFFCGPANKNTANDNTSGVATLLEIIGKMPEDKREKAAFIFFDHEEIGLFGSAGYASKHKSEKANKLVVNFDCVSDGKNILFVFCKGAKKYKASLEKHFVSNDTFNVEMLDKGVFYPSDQANFHCGVGVAALKYSKKLNTLYMDRIHTKNDTIFEEENIAYLSDHAVSLAVSE